MSRSPDLPGARSLTDFIKSERQPNVMPETGWIHVGVTNAELGGLLSPPFQNSWTNASGAYAPASFMLSEDGFVRMRGALADGSDGTIAFTLPDGYRPEYTSRFQLPFGTTGYAVVDVSPDGDVTIVSTT